MAFVIQVNTPPQGASTEQVKVASSPGQTHSLLGETTAPTKRISAGSNSGRHYCTEIHVRIILLLAHKRIALIGILLHVLAARVTIYYTCTYTQLSSFSCHFWKHFNSVATCSHCNNLPSDRVMTETGV